MNRKLSVCLYSPPSLLVKSYFDMIDLAVKYGLKNIEAKNIFELSTPNSQLALKIKEYADRNGVAVPCLSISADIVKEGGERFVKKVSEYCKTAKILGAERLHHTIALGLDRPSEVIKNRSFYYEQGVKSALKIRNCANEFGLSTVYENHGYVFNGTKGFSLFMRDIGGDCGIIADTGNILFAEEKAVDFIMAFSKKIVNVHIKDYKICNGIKKYTTFGGKSLFECAPGDGDADVINALNLLKDSGYSGTLSLECSPHGKGTEYFEKGFSFIKNGLLL